MAVLVFRLNDVPDNEAQAVRDLLTDNHIPFYETSAGKWGFSIAGIWIENNDDRDRARALIEDYQAEHIARMRDYHRQLREEGRLESFVSRLLTNPLQILVYIILVVVIIYLTVFPFLSI